MKTLEELVADKMCDLVNYVLSKVIKPDISIGSVRELDEEAIAGLKQQYGIEGIILDVDQTLRRNMKNIPECNKEWIDTLRNQLKVIIVSNGIDRNVEQFFKERGIDYIGFAQKPLRKNFLLACKKLGVEPQKVMVIGDSLFSDIYGGNRNNMTTVHVERVKEI